MKQVVRVRPQPIRLRRHDTAQQRHEAGHPGAVGDGIRQRDVVRERTPGLRRREPFTGQEDKRAYRRGRDEGEHIQPSGYRNDERKAPIQDGGQVVGVAFDRGPELQQVTPVRLTVGQRTADQKTGSDGGRRRAHPGPHRDVAPDGQVKVRGFASHSSDASQDEFLAQRPGVRITSLEGERSFVALRGFDLERHGQRGRQTVESGAEVGRGRRSPDLDAHHHPSN
jgi:hypothetical protein